MDLRGYGELTLIDRGRRFSIYRGRRSKKEVIVKVFPTAPAPARLRHKNIVPVLDRGITAEGKPYLCVPYYEEGSLEEALRDRGPLTVPEVQRGGLAIASALAYAHRKAVVHGELTPGCVQGSYAVGDFGLPRASDSSSATLIDRVSYIHMSPQVLDGVPPAAADDVWSLGSVLFTLLDGKPPFAGSGPGPDLALAYLKRVRTGEPRQLSRLDTPDALASLIGRCLQRERTSRPTAAEAMETLAALVPATRSRALLVVSAAVAVALAVAAATFWLRQSGQPVIAGPATGAPVPRQSVALPGSAASADPALAPAIEKLTVRGSGAELSWRDPTGGRAIFVVVQFDGQKTLPLRQFGRGTTVAVVDGLDPAAPEFCFGVVSILDTGAYGMSAAKCAVRSSAG